MWSGLTKRGYMLSMNGPFFGPIMLCMKTVFAKAEVQVALCSTYFKRYPFYIARLVLLVWHMVTEYNVWRMILKSCAWRVISKHCIRHPSDTDQTQLFKTLHLAGVWQASGAMFWNHMSCAMFKNQVSGSTFQNLPPDAIFCDYASDVYHEWHSVVQNLNQNAYPAMYK